MIGLANKNADTKFHDLKNMFAVTSHIVYTQGSTTFAAGANKNNNVTFSNVKPGFFPIGIVGVVTDGNYSTYISIVQIRITEASSGSVKINCYLHNHATTAATSITTTVYVLWVKEE